MGERARILPIPKGQPMADPWWRSIPRNGPVMLKRLAEVCLRRHRRVVLVWIVGIVVLGAAMGAVGSGYRSDFTLPDVESGRGIDILDERFGATLHRPTHRRHPPHPRLRQARAHITRRAHRRSSPPRAMNPTSADRPLRSGLSGPYRWFESAPCNARARAEHVAVQMETSGPVRARPRSRVLGAAFRRPSVVP